MIKGEDALINGDGKTSRDLCLIENTVQMNLLAATAPDQAKSQVYDVAMGDHTTLNTLPRSIRTALTENGVPMQVTPTYREFLAVDVHHSKADISNLLNALGYAPQYRFS